MTTETNAWRTAWIIAEQYGSDGVSFAAQMAQNFQVSGKTATQQEWLSIMHKIEVLTSMNKANTLPM